MGSTPIATRFLAASILVVAFGCGSHHEGPPWAGHPVARSALAGADGGAQAYAVPPPPFSKKSIFPCSDCHNDPELRPNLTPRELEEHTKIKLSHGDRERWCFDCHNPDQRDSLRLASGTLVPFEESYRLCGQCHGDKYRDWRAGVHGKRTGSWNGEKQYLLCAHCHNPHAPAFKPIKPLPPPHKPMAL